ncbi:hypothetical protein SteCoe_14200 [Stentor coeruleus]|uniref:Alpha-tubulin N-acetyltransferase n=1 Tax=Stentor coeruleus TaxID=5963 RepID=A0A1R2C6K0_9CILI|nr:hypothetical protein SteCoe_14200 [Stentor coeruleus]
MEFKFDVRRVVRCNNQGIYLLLPQNSLKTKEMCEIIDVMGRESSRSQGLRSIITTAVRFFSSSDNKIYLKIEGQKVVGILKTGVRKLFYTNEIGKLIEMSPLCLLDFYVHESFQRSGYGKELYEYMLQEENTTPNKVPIDRPSAKLIGFMRKHYNLSDYIPQNNNYVIYRQYFSYWDMPVTRKHEEIKNSGRPASNSQDRGLTNDNERSPNDIKNERNSPYSQERHGTRVENQYQRSPYGPGSGVRAETQYEKNWPNPQDRSIERDDTKFERRVGLAQAEKILEKHRLLDNSIKKTYAPTPPWATQTRDVIPGTTSSQYGNYSHRK